MTHSPTLACTVHGALDLRLEARALDYLGALRANGEFELALDRTRSTKVQLVPNP